MTHFPDPAVSRKNAASFSADDAKHFADMVEEVFLQALAEKTDSPDGKEERLPTEAELRDARNTALASLPQPLVAVVADIVSAPDGNGTPFAPFFAEEIPRRRLSILAATGSLCGMLLLEPVANHFLGIPKMGFFLGAPLGAWLLPTLLLRIVENSALRRSLFLALGVAAFADLTGLGPASLMKRFFDGTSSRTGRVRRLLLLGSAALLFFLCKPRRIFRRRDAATALGSGVRAALDAEAKIRRESASSSAPDAVPSREALETLSRLANPLEDLAAACTAPKGQERDEELRTAMVHLFQEAALAGLVLGKTPHDAVLTWSDDLAERYETFGHILPGDSVRVERRPVLWNDKVLSKGLLRKRRPS